MWFNDYLLIDFSRAKSRKQLAKLENNHLFITVFMRLFSDAMKRYKIEGLPDTCNERVILESLVIYGSVVFFEENGSILALPGVPSGKGWNIYGDPLSSWVFSRNGLFNQEIGLYVEGGMNDRLLYQGNGNIDAKHKSGVMAWENKNRYPFINTVIYYARAISDTLRTIDVSRKWLKRPFVPVCEESLIPTVKKIFEDMADNSDLIPVSTGVLDINKFDLKPVDFSPEAVKSASELVEWYENKYRELCGTNSNTQMDKKGENLISDEVHANDEYTGKAEGGNIETLNHYFDIVNSQFGINVKAVSNETEQENTQEGGDDNGANDDIQAED